MKVPTKKRKKLRYVWGEQFRQIITLWHVDVAEPQWEVPTNSPSVPFYFQNLYINA
jgi:hypothetical protein